MEHLPELIPHPSVWNIAFVEDVAKPVPGAQPPGPKDKDTSVVVRRYWTLAEDYIVPGTAFSTRRFPIELMRKGSTEWQTFLLTETQLRPLLSKAMGIQVRTEVVDVLDITAKLVTFEITKMTIVDAWRRFWQSQKTVTTTRQKVGGRLEQVPTFKFPMSWPNNVKKDVTVIADDGEYPDPTKMMKIDENRPGVLTSGDKNGVSNALHFIIGIVIDDVPDKTQHPQTGYFWKLRPGNLDSAFANGGYQKPRAAYIWFSKSTGPLDGTPLGSRLAYRNELGVLEWMVLPDRPAIRSSDNWNDWYRESTLGGDADGWRTRHINPRIKLTIVPGGTGRLKFGELKSMFEEVSTEENPPYEVLRNETEGQVLLGVSPFGDYETWINANVHKQYLNCRPDQPLPDGKAVVEKACEKLKNFKERKYIMGTGIVPVSLSADNIKNARGTRKHLPAGLGSQATVMGGSATKIAKVLGWVGVAGPSRRVAAIWDTVAPEEERVAWPATGVYPAEWLHLCAYSWAGGEDDKDFEGSQTPENMIFGTSETNSLMTRYEQAWQHLFTAEDSYRKKYMKHLQPITGTLRTTSRGEPRIRRSASRPRFFDEDKWEENVTDENHWTRQAEEARASWLCYALKYEMTLNDLSRIIYPGPKSYSTMFYPFQRPFFTGLEAAADKRILEFFVERAGLYAGATDPLKYPKGIRPQKWVKTDDSNNPEWEFDPDHYNGAKHPGVEEADAKGPYPDDSRIREPDLDLELHRVYAIRVNDGENNSDEHQEVPFKKLPLITTGISSIVRERIEEIPYQRNRRQETPKLVQVRPSLSTEPALLPVKTTIQANSNTLPTYRNQPTPSTKKHLDFARPGASEVGIDNIAVRKPQFRLIDKEAETRRAAVGMIDAGEKSSAVGPEELITNPVEPTNTNANIEKLQSGLSNIQMTLIQATTAQSLINNLVTVLPSLGVASFSSPSGDSPVVPKALPGFTAIGRITLFGQLSAELYTSDPSTGHGTTERVVITTELSLGTFIPSLAGSPLDMFKLCNTSLTYRDTMTESQPPGLMLCTEVKIDGALDGINEVLSGVFGMKDPFIHVSGMISMNRDWEELLAPLGFTLRSELRDMSMRLFNGAVEVVNLGVDIMGTRTVKQTDTGQVTRGYEMAIGFFGAALVRVHDGSPMKGTWYLQKSRTAYSINVCLASDEWTNLFGIQGLDLRDVEFSANFSSLSLIQSATLEIQARLKIRSGTLVLAGHYSKLEWSIAAHLRDVSLKTLAHIYEDFFGPAILSDSDDHDIQFDSISLVIGSTGFYLQGTVTVNGHTSYSAKISISKNGISIAGAVGELTVLDGLVTIDHAELDVFIGSLKTGDGAMEVKVAVSGSVKIKELNFTVGIHYHQNSQGKKECTVYGEMEGALQLAQLSSQLRGSVLDLEIRKIALIASNEENPDVAVLNTMRYPVKKGIQICATIGSISQLTTLTKSSVTELQLCATWAKGDSFEITIIYQPDDTIRFSDNVSSGPLGLGVRVTKDGPAIFIDADLIVKLEKQPDPLRFHLELDVGLKSAGGSASMLNTWKNPFGLGDDIVVGPLTLAIAIDFVVFPVTGMPKTFIFEGHLTINTTTADIIFYFHTQNPDQQLISAKFINFDFSELLRFAAQRVGFTPNIPPDCKLLVLNVFSLYLSTGVEYNGKQYPAGISFEADLVLFDHKAVIHASLSIGDFMIYGSIESFEIGGLKVFGAQPGTNPTINITISRETQTIIINGAVDFEGAVTSIDVHMEMLPATKFDFVIAVDFIGALKLQLQAHMVPGSKGDPKDMDFTLEAVVENHILQELVRSLSEHLLPNDDEVGLPIGVAAARQKLRTMVMERSSSKREAVVRTLESLAPLVEDPVARDGALARILEANAELFAIDHKNQELLRAINQHKWTTVRVIDPPLFPWLQPALDTLTNAVFQSLRPVGQLLGNWGLQIRRISIRGSLKGMLQGQMPLTATVELEAFGLPLPKFDIGYFPGNQAHFLTSLLEAIQARVGL